MAPKRQVLDTLLLIALTKAINLERKPRLLEKAYQKRQDTQSLSNKWNIPLPPVSFW
jgi:hypothetical protein